MRDKIGPGIFGGDTYRIFEDAARSLYPALDNEWSIPSDGSVDSAMRKFAEKAKSRLFDYVTNPENAENIDYNVLGLVNPVPTQEIETGESYTEEEVIPPNLLEEISKDQAANDPYENPRTRTVEKRRTKTIIHPDVEYAIKDYVHDSQILLDLYDFTGNFGYPTLADDAPDLFYDPKKAVRDMGIGGLAQEVDTTLYNSVARGAEDVKEKLARDVLEDGGMAVGYLWDEMGYALKKVDSPNRKFTKFVDNVNAVEEMWYNVDDAKSAERLADWIYKNVFLFGEDVAEELPEGSEAQELVWEALGAADEASSALGSAADEMKRYSSRTARRGRRSQTRTARGGHPDLAQELASSILKHHDEVDRRVIKDTVVAAVNQSMDLHDCVEYLDASPNWYAGAEYFASAAEFYGSILNLAKDALQEDVSEIIFDRR